MEFNNLINSTPISPIKKFYDYYSSSNTLIKRILIITLVMFFPFFIIFYLSSMVFKIAEDSTKLTLKIRQKQKEREEFIKRQEQKRKAIEEFNEEQERNRKEMERVVKEQERIEEQRREERIIAHKNNAEEFESEIVKLIKDRNVIIDSNLWMDYEFECFFGGLLNILNKYDYILNLCGAQFDEICNIKRKSEDDKRLKANKAIKRIEKYQVEKVLKINSISCHEKKHAYADPAILEYLISEYPKNGGIALITNDKGLRVRARQVFEDKGFSNYIVFDGDRFKDLAESFCLINNIDIKGFFDNPS